MVLICIDVFCYNFIFLEYYGVYNYGGIKMINGRGRNFLYKSYICAVQKNINEMFESLIGLKNTCSISADFINQFIIYQGVAEKISKTTALCTNFRPVFNIASEISKKRCEMLGDIKKIKVFCGNFKNCPAGIKNYKIGFKEICSDYAGILKNIGDYGNMNIFFLNFMMNYNEFSVLLSRNALKYRLCPELRLISEYSAMLGKKENIKMREILNIAKNKTPR